MRFSEIVKEAREWLQRDGRISYRALKREFALDDESLDDLKFELIKAKRLATDEDGEVLVSRQLDMGNSGWNLSRAVSVYMYRTGWTYHTTN